jgi:hypothetical protein
MYEDNDERLDSPLDNSLITNDIAKALLKHCPSITRITSYPASIVLVYLYKQQLEEMKVKSKAIVELLDAPASNVYGLLDRLVKAGLVSVDATGLLNNVQHYRVTQLCIEILEGI